MYNRVLGRIEKYTVVDLFPYKIKDYDAFVNRKHIPFNEDDPRSVTYAEEVARRFVEGHWVNDKGTWVFMMPKLYYFVNLGTVNIEQPDKSKKLSPADMWDNSWAIFSYLLCCDGFSGFSDDEEITCHRDVLRIEQGDTLPPAIIKKLERDHCKKPDGTWKKYMEAWEYLTAYYLIERPLGKPLGKCMYGNTAKNAMILGSRKSQKTVCLAGGDFCHEIATCGTRSIESYRKKEQYKINMFVGAWDGVPLQNFLDTALDSWDNMPGGSVDEDSPWKLPMLGSWTADRETLEQGYREAGTNKKIGSGSKIHKAIILPHKVSVLASKRVRRDYIDETGLLSCVDEYHETAVDSRGAVEGQSGVGVYSGTGGNVNFIQATQRMANSPHKYNIYPIPNYWTDGKPFVLFLSAAMTLLDYKVNGCTDMMEATKAVLYERKLMSGGDDSKIISERQHKPLEPSEIFLAGKSDKFSKEILVPRIELLESGLFRDKAKLYDLELGKRKPDGTYDVYPHEKHNWDNVIVNLEYGDKTGELIVFEPPMENLTAFSPYDGDYKIFMDPVSDRETGRSYFVVKVWKGVPRRSLQPGEMVNNIVATFKGRRSEDDDHLKLALCLSMWYKAKIQYERNISGIPRYFKSFGLKWILQATPHSVMKDVSPSTRNMDETGIYMSDTKGVGLKTKAMRLLQEWHKSIAYVDEAGRAFRHIETTYDISLLYEMAQYNAESNLDDISAMLILMLWLEEENIPGQEEEAPDDLTQEFEELALAAYQIHGSY